MKRVSKNWFVRFTYNFAALTSMRLISTVLHMTALERLYKPRDFRRTSHLEISEDVIVSLPRYCTNVLGQSMDPINLLFLGTEAGLRRAFEKAGWDTAHPSTPVHLLRGLFSSIFKRSYRRGPFMPLFISIGLQDMAFQKSTLRNKFAQRHHIRIWRTRHTLADGSRLWTAAATYDSGIKLTVIPPFVVHRKNPDLDFERDYIANELLESGNLMAGEHIINDPISARHPRRDPHGDEYYTDGHAKVIQIV